MISPEEFRMSRSLAIAVAVAAALIVACARPLAKVSPKAGPPATVHAQQAVTLASLQTTAEASDFKSTSTYEDVVTFMKTVADAAPTIVHYTTYGTTYE